MKSDEDRFSERMVARCPPALLANVERAAQQRFSTSSEYIRAAVVDRLRADGVKLENAA